MVLNIEKEKSRVALAALLMSSATLAQLTTDDVSDLATMYPNGKSWQLQIEEDKIFTVGAEYEFNVGETLATAKGFTYVPTGLQWGNTHTEASYAMAVQIVGS